MDSRKKAKLVQLRGKKRMRFAKGGRVPGRQNFDTGGLAALTGVTGLTPTLFPNGNPLVNQFGAASVPLTPGTNAGQLTDAYGRTQTALNNQNALVQTLQPEAARGVTEQDLAAQSAMNMLNGTGPNPAQTQLATATGNNVANQAALMAGQRGASVNPGLIARESAQQGAATQQQAAGQAATLNAEQQVAAQNTLAGLGANQIGQVGQAVTNQNSAEQGEQGTLQNANTSLNNAAVGQQSNLNNVNSQVSAGNQNMAGKELGAIGSAISAVGGLAKGGVVDKDHHLRLAEMNAHSLKHSLKFDEGGEVSDGPHIEPTAPLPSDSGGGGMNPAAIMSMASSVAAMADGGPVIGQNPLLQGQQMHSSQWVNGYFNPGQSSSGPNIGSTQALPENTEDFGKDIKDDVQKFKKNSDSSSDSSDQNDEFMTFSRGGHVARYFSEGGPVDSMVSEGEVYLNPEQVHKVIHEDADPAKIGMKIKARNASQKATIKGDSLKNDKIPMTLEEGGVVVDRKNMGSSDKRKLFVHRALARKKASA